jgi:hypothetical protein
MLSAAKHLANLAVRPDPSRNAQDDTLFLMVFLYYNEAMREYSKSIKRKFRELNSLAYERELTKHLHLLASNFDDWKRKNLSCWDLEELIHKFHNGKARELYTFYNNSIPELAVASALTRGLLSREEIPDDICEHIEGCLSSFENKTQESQ